MRVKGIHYTVCCNTIHYNTIQYNTIDLFPPNKKIVCHFTNTNTVQLKNTTYHIVIEQKSTSTHNIHYIQLRICMYVLHVDNTIQLHVLAVDRCCFTVYDKVNCLTKICKHLQT